MSLRALTARVVGAALALALAPSCTDPVSPRDASAFDLPQPYDADTERPGEVGTSDAPGPEVGALEALRAEVDDYLTSESLPEEPPLLERLDTVYRDVPFSVVLDAVRAVSVAPAARPRGVVGLRWVNPSTGAEAVGSAYVPAWRSDHPEVPAPLVVFLHGAGGNGEEVTGAPELQSAAEALGVLLVAPSSEAVCDWSGSERCMSQTLAALRHVKRRWRVRDDRVVLTGFSMGGRGSFSVGAAYPEPWCGVVPLAGSIGAIYNTTDVARHQAYCCPHAENLLRARVHHVIGGADLAAAVALNRGCAACFASLGADARYTEPVGLGHAIPFDLWREAVAWSLERPRESYPRRVAYNLQPQSSSITTGGVYFHQTLRESLGWVRLDARHDAARPARLVAAVEGGALTVETVNVARLTLFLADELVDLAQPVRVTLDGVVAHDGVVTRDRRLLLTEARRRADRTMTFAAALTLDVPR